MKRRSSTIAMTQHMDRTLGVEHSSRVIKRPSSFWFAMPAFAIQLSLGAVTSAIAAVGVFFLPTEAERILSGNHCYVTHVVPMEGGHAVSLIRLRPKHLMNAPLRYQLATHRLDADEPAVDLVCPELSPTCLVRGSEKESLFVGTADGTIHSLRFQNGVASTAFVAQQQHDGCVFNLACSRDGCVLVSSGAESMHAWNVADGSLKWRLDDLQPLCFAIHPSSKSLVCGTSSGAVLEIALNTGSTLRVLKGFPKPTFRAAISHDGNLVAAVGGDGQVAIRNWETEMSAWPVEASGLHKAISYGTVSFSPDDSLLVAQKNNGWSTLCVWDVRTGSLLGELPGHRVQIIHTMFDEDGLLFSWDAEGKIIVWDSGKRRALRVISLASARARRLESSTGRTAGSFSGVRDSRRTRGWVRAPHRVRSVPSTERVGEQSA